MSSIKEVKEFIKGFEGVRLATEDLSSDNSFVYSFNCPPIDIPLGGGILSGRIYEIFGEESHGKSTWALDIAKTFCDYWDSKNDSNYVVLWIESESTFDKVRASFFGCNVDRFVVYETDVLEDGRDIIRGMLARSIQKKTKLLIVWDTIAAVSTKNEKIAGVAAAKNLVDLDDDDDEDGKSKTNPGGLTEKPRLIKSMLRDVTMPLGQTNSTFIILNQAVTQVAKYGAPVDSAGGRGLRHFASVRAKITKVDSKEVVSVTGIKKTKSITCVIDYKKNKITGSNLSSEVKFDLETGMDKLETRVMFMKKIKLLPPGVGGWTTAEVVSGYCDKTKITPAGKVMVPGTVEIKFQTIKQLEDLITSKHPHLVDWFDYKIYDAYCTDSPLIKIRNIEKLWKYEEMFFGERKTVLTDREKQSAELMIEQINKEEEKELKVEKLGKLAKKPKGIELHA